MSRTLSENERKFIASLIKCGVRMSVDVMGGTYSADEEWIARYLEDIDAFEAVLQDVTVDELRAFKAARGTTYCSATTKKGRPCKNIVPGGYSEYSGSSQGMVRRWLNKQGMYCAFHEDARDVSRQ